MTKETPQYHPQFEQEVKGVVVGEGNIIYNYYYSHEVKPVDEEGHNGDGLPCPYRGLFHFGPNDAEFFFGRDVFIQELYDATQTRRFIPVIGASGSGKSSVVFAGLVPRLQQEGHWQFTYFHPGSDPFHALALALVPLYTPKKNETERIKQARQLANDLQNGEIPLADVFIQIQHNYLNDRVLLIADQFEELYTLCPDATIRRHFLNQLMTDLPAVLVMTMRADFLGNALSYPAFGERLRNADIKIRSMNREELTEVIVKPAEADKLGVTFEEGLVERILDDVEDQPGSLPLLEFALTQLWNQRSGKQLTHTVYDKIGQVEGALASHADEQYSKLTDEEKEKIRRIFIQLVRPGEGSEDTRRIALKNELGAENWELVTKKKGLADSRLVVTSQNALGQETVEVVHEALIRNWRELRKWINVDRVFLSWLERLRAAQRQWEATNHDPGSLLRGAALAEAEEKLAERPEDLIAEKEFIEQSIKERERIEQEKAARRRREIRTAWGITIGSLVAVALSTGLFLNARYQQKQAELSEADSLARSALSLLNEGKDLDAFLAAIQAGKILQRYKATDSEVMSALIANIYEGSERNRLHGHDDWVYGISVSPDDQFLFSGSKDTTIKVWKLKTGDLIDTLEGHKGSVISVSASPDGQFLFSGNDYPTIKVWNWATWDLIDTLEGHTGAVHSVIVNPDGQTLISASTDLTIRVWNLATGEEIHSLSGHSHPVYSVSISRDGQTLVSGSIDKTIKMWNPVTGDLIRTLSGHRNWFHSVSISPDGKTIIAGSSDNTIKIWNLDFDWLMRHSCSWVGAYLSNPNADLSEEERRICDDVSNEG